MQLEAEALTPRPAPGADSMPPGGDGRGNGCTGDGSGSTCMADHMEQLQMQNGDLQQAPPDPRGSRPSSRICGSQPGSQPGSRPGSQQRSRGGTPGLPRGTPGTDAQQRQQQRQQQPPSAGLLPPQMTAVAAAQPDQVEGLTPQRQLFVAQQRQQAQLQQQWQQQAQVLQWQQMQGAGHTPNSALLQGGQFYGIPGIAPQQLPPQPAAEWNSVGLAIPGTPGIGQNGIAHSAPALPQWETHPQLAKQQPDTGLAGLMGRFESQSLPTPHGQHPASALLLQQATMLGIEHSQLRQGSLPTSHVLELQQLQSQQQQQQQAQVQQLQQVAVQQQVAQQQQAQQHQQMVMQQMLMQQRMAGGSGISLGFFQQQSAFMPFPSLYGEYRLDPQSRSLVELPDSLILGVADVCLREHRSAVVGKAPPVLCTKVTD